MKENAIKCFLSFFALLYNLYKNGKNKQVLFKIILKKPLTFAI